MTKFYDTCALINLQEKVFQEKFYISDITLLELNKIKEDRNKTEELRFKVRKLIHLLHENQNTYTIFYFTEDVKKYIERFTAYSFPDIQIIGCASWAEHTCWERVLFCTSDLLCEKIAQKIFGLKTLWISENPKEQELYLGYKMLQISDEELAALLETGCSIKDYGCIENEYLITLDRFEKLGGVFKYKNGKYEIVRSHNFKNKILGDIRPLDPVQICAFDSLKNNEITVLYGKSGSGKTTIPLSYILKGLENQEFRKIHIIYHYEPLKGARTLGYEKGDHIEKLLKSASIGNILSSKFGDISIIESMLQDGTLEIVPTANIRGVEFAPEDVVFCTEVQNIDTYTLKTIIQRCKAGCKQIYEGDILEQTDIFNTSGLFKMIELFKGNSKFGCVKLKNRYRNELSDLADKLL